MVYFEDKRAQTLLSDCGVSSLVPPCDHRAWLNNRREETKWCSGQEYDYETNHAENGGNVISQGGLPETVT